MSQAVTPTLYSPSVTASNLPEAKRLHVNAENLKRRRRYRLEMIERYGGQCFCCSEDQWEFLALDHVHGGGNKQRDALAGAYKGNQIYFWLKKQGWPSGYRIACHNCNSSIGSFGACAHDGEEPKRTSTLCADCEPKPFRRKIDLCKPCWDAKMRVYLTRSLRKLKRETIEHYGGKCACCGDGRFNFMTLDHPDGGGNEERARLAGNRRAAGVVFYRILRLKGFPPGYRALCWNCQLARGYYGYCPHEAKPEEVHQPLLALV